MDNDYRVLLGSDGAALEFLRKEFPQLPFIILPSYDIRYPKNSIFFKPKLLLALPRMQRAIHSEKKIIKNLVAEGRIHGIISDNRPGVHSESIPSVYLTHQIRVLSGSTSFFSSKLHQEMIKKFDACWVPDSEAPENLSGDLGHPAQVDFPITYIGPLSRMVKKEVPQQYDVLVLLSGPEPQRTLLEKKLIAEFMNTPKKVLLVRGVIEESQQQAIENNITIVNYMTRGELEQAINESKVVVARSGYTTIMDLATMQKKAFLIPTPGQYEQQYLAKRLKETGVAPSCQQHNFTASRLADISLYSGLRSVQKGVVFSKLFSLFEGK